MSEEEILNGIKTYLSMEDGGHLTNLLNALSFLKEGIREISWLGFYEYDGDVLNLSLFQGSPACLKIKPGKGVVGTSFQEEKDIYVPDVNAFPGHIACDSRSKSEIVYYLNDGSRRCVIFDIDSHEYDALEKHIDLLKKASLLLYGSPYFLK